MVTPIGPGGGHGRPQPDHLTGLHASVGGDPITWDREPADPDVRRADEGLDDVDVVDLLLEDHRLFERMFDAMEEPGASAERRRELLEVVVAELSRHGAVEERHLYPVARSAFEDGDHVVEHEIEEHNRIEEAMAALTKVDVDDAEFDERLRTLVHEVRHHLEEEETELFPKLREHCDPQELREIAVRIRSAKGTAPTRPHPKMPDTPPWNAVAAPVLGAADRIRDELSGRPTSPEDLSDGGAEVGR